MGYEGAPDCNLKSSDVVTMCDIKSSGGRENF